MRVTTNPVSKCDVDNQRYCDMLYWRNKVAEVLRHAATNGVVVTVGNPPNQPLAMGNYDLVVDARPLRNYKG